MADAIAGKHIWLIGASEGIGRAVALQLAAAGAHLTLSARQIDRLQSLLGELPGSGHRAVACDVTQTDSVSAAWAEASASTAPDMLIYNAGVYEPMAATAINLAAAEMMLDVNYRGAVRVLAQAVPAMQARGDGHIVLVASVAGYRGLPGAIGYGASKAALLHLAENLRCDLPRSKIKVQVVNPGFVATRLTAKNDFSMPGIISVDAAARAFVRGLRGRAFEIRFPWLFTSTMKLLSWLPTWLYFPIVSRQS
jgi:short-subunit dehydrogenase